MSSLGIGRRDRICPSAIVVLAVGLLCLIVVGCGSAAGSAGPSSGPIATIIPSEAAGEGGTTSGDVPDDAVFLSYADQAHGFSIQYVEGWQVRRGEDGVEIRDKDSSETVALVAGVTDLATFVRDSDLPALQALPRFSLVKQDTVRVGTLDLAHLTYHLPAPPDPVTGKEVPSIVERYYVPGATSLAVISLSTPDGVDNVDAFRHMIESFAWTS